MKKLNALHIIDVTNTIFVGDVHGKFGDLGFLIKNKNEITNSVFIAVGDVGLGFEQPGFYKHQFEKLSKRLSHGDNHLFFMRGNHDNPSEYTELHNICDNITVLPDYSVVDINNTKILVIGGAISIDRIYRVPGRTWWYNEKVVFNEEKLKSFNDINIIATHTAPQFCHPITKDNIKGWIMKDETLDVELNEEREILSKIFNILDKNNILTHWFYGHFHNSHNEFINKIHFFALDELEFVSI